MTQTRYTLGIDIGSTTVKIAILDEEKKLLFSDYERHFANIQETLSSLLKKAHDSLGELTFLKTVQDSFDLLRCLAFTVDGFSITVTKLSVMIQIGITQIFIRKLL